HKSAIGGRRLGRYAAVSMSGSTALTVGDRRACSAWRISSTDSSRVASRGRAVGCLLGGPWEANSDIGSCLLIDSGFRGGSPQPRGWGESPRNAEALECLFRIKLRVDPHGPAEVPATLAFYPQRQSVYAPNILERTFFRL